MGWIELWKGALMKPKETFAAAKGKADFGEALKMIAVGGVVGGALMGIAVMMYASLLGGMFGGFLGVAMGAAFGAASIVMFIIMGVVGGIIGSIVISYILVYVGKMMGGKGNFNQQLYLLALVQAPAAIIMGVLFLIPLLGFVLVGLFGLYCIYLEVLAISEAQGLDLLKAFVTLIIAAIVVGIIYWIVMAIVGMLIGASIMGAYGAYGNLPVYPTP